MIPTVKIFTQIDSFPYKIIFLGGRDDPGQRTYSQFELPIVLGTTDDLGSELYCIIVASDIQGNIENGN